MEVGFGSAALAALCNSEERLARQWGAEIGRTVGRRLFDVAAATAVTLERIPGAVVTSDDLGEITITFAGELVIRGVVAQASTRGRRTHADADLIVITSVDVHGNDR